MNLVSQIALAAMASLLAFSVLRIFFTIVRNLIKGFEFRRHLGGRISELRLSRMLGALGVDIPCYLHQRSVVDIEAHMRACQGCGTKSTCDEQLAGKRRTDDYSFCPNYGALSSLDRAPAGKVL